MPTIANDLAAEERFRIPRLLRDHGVVSAVNVIIRTEGLVFGVLEADSREPRAFSAGDTQFLQAYANILALAIAQHRLADENRRLSDHATLLLHEFRHRNKNSQQLLVSLLHLKKNDHRDEKTRELIQGISDYIMMLSKSDELLMNAGLSASIELGGYLSNVARCVLASIALSGVAMELETVAVPLMGTSQQAQYLALILGEFVTNSAKHGKPAGRSEIRLHLSRDGGTGRLELFDGGPGIADHANQGTGMRLMAALAASLGGEAAWLSGPVAHLRIAFPIADLPPSR